MMFRKKIFKVHEACVFATLMCQLYNYVLIDNAGSGHNNSIIRDKFFGHPHMFRSPRNGFDDTLSAKRSADAAARAASLAATVAEDVKPELLALMRQVATIASQAAARAAIAAEAAELAAVASNAAALAAVASNAAALAASAAEVAASKAELALKCAADPTEVELLTKIRSAIRGEFGAEAEAVSRLVEFATASATTATRAAEAAADAAETAALIAESAAKIVSTHKQPSCNKGTPPVTDATAQSGSGYSSPCSIISSDDNDGPCSPRGQWIAFMNRFT